MLPLGPTRSASFSAAWRGQRRQAADPGPLRQPSDTDVPPVFGLFVFRFALMAQIASILVPFPGHWNGVRFAGRVRALGTLRAA